jgi:hypothetical protein
MAAAKTAPPLGSSFKADYHEQSCCGPERHILIDSGREGSDP